MNKIQYIKAVFLVALLAAVACSPKVDTHGYSNDDDWKKEIIVGKTTKDQVLEKLGSPSAQSSFGNETWYYIANRKETYAFLKPKVVEQNVVRVEFDSAGLVSNIENYNKDSGKDVDLVKRTTPTEGHSMNFFEQILGNIGRFNTPEGASSSIGHPTPGIPGPGGR